jgi:hypothetical protein
MLLNPVDGSPLIDAFAVSCLSYREAMAEKLRAALTRREVAIRDFFDVDYAVRNGALTTSDRALLDLLRRKLQVSGDRTRGCLPRSRRRPARPAGGRAAARAA